MSITRTLLAGESQSVSETGGRFYFESGSGEILVKVNLNGGARDYELKPGMGFVIPNGERFYSLEIHNGMTPQSIDFTVSDAEVFDNRSTISSGSDALPVEVSGDKRAENGQTYMGFVDSGAPANPERFAVVGVKNTGLNPIYIEEIDIYSSGPGGVLGYICLAESFEGMRADFYDTESDVDTVVDNAGHIGSKCSTDPALYAGAELFSANTLLDVDGINASAVAYLFVQSGLKQTDFSGRFCVKPGGTLFLLNKAAGTGILANFQISYV